MIQGKKIHLRTIREKDLDEVYDNLSNLSYRGDFYPLLFPSETKFRADFNATGFWSENSSRLLITDLKGNIVGLIHAFKAIAYSDALELSYMLFGAEHYNKGYVTEAVTLFTDYLFKSLRLNRIQIAMATKHEASKRVAEKCGFKHEAILREMFPLNGVDQDIHVLSMLRKEWAQKNR